MSKTKLLNCPFCGGEVVLKKHHNRFTEWWLVSCPDCHISQTGNSYEFSFEAINAWNNRKPVDAVLEELKQYQSQYESGLGGFTDELVDRVLRNAIAIVEKGLA